MLIIPTCQRSAVDLVRIGTVIEDEKDRLLERVSATRNDVLWVVQNAYGQGPAWKRAPDYGD